jgi:hypothetical protein
MLISPLNLVTSVDAASERPSAMVAEEVAIVVASVVDEETVMVPWLPY